MLGTIESVKKTFMVAECEVANDINHVFRGNHAIPVFNEECVHFLDIVELPVAILYDVGVVEMLIRSKENHRLSLFLLKNGSVQIVMKRIK